MEFIRSFIFCLIVVVGLVAIFLLRRAALVFWISPEKMWRRLKANGFDGPPPEFPLGNLSEMSKRLGEAAVTSAGCSNSGVSKITHSIHSSVFPYFARWRKAHGKVFIYWLGTEPFLYIADPEFLKQVTSGVLGKKWGKPDVFKHDRKPMFGKGLVMVEGDDWARHRHIIAPVFSITNLNAMIGLMEESTFKMLEQWSKNVDLGHSEIDVEKEIVRNAAEIIAKTCFGLSEQKGKEVFEKLQVMQAMLFKTNRLVGVPFSKFMYVKQSYNSWKLGKEIDQLLLEIIESRKEEAGGGDRQDLLGLLLAGNQKNARLERKMTARELVDECKTFFFGGHETTALALTWTLLLLALHPEWQTALREEVMEVCDGRPLDSSMLSKLTKMGWVWNEVLRLYSPAPNAQRQARENISVGGGGVIPKGTNMWIDVVGMHHDSALWGSDVDEFRPERFREDPISGGCKHRMGYLPFGFGGRICVGRNLSALEYKIVLSHVLRRFSMSLSPAYAHEPRIMLSLRPSQGVHLILRRIGELG